jgi:hypothetical protein
MQGYGRVEHDLELTPQWVRVSRIVGVWIALAVGTATNIWIAFWDGAYAQVIDSHTSAIFGVPWACGVATVVVSTLRSSVGKIEFKVLGAEFQGASGPAAMWVICFLAQTLAIRVLW